MRAISLGSLVVVCLVAAACSSTTGSGGQGGQVGSGGSGAGGSSAGGAGGSGNNGVGGHSGDAGPDATDGGTTDCNPACASGSVCVGTGVQGGAVFFADGGVCPAGRHAQGNICIQDLTFACMPIPSGCNGTATCACASSLCTGHGSCGAPSPGELTCIQFVP